MEQFNIYQVIEEYQPNNSIFSEEEEKTHRIKKIIFNKMDETDRRIILAYSEIGNIRDTAKLFKVSPTTIWIKIKEIREKIINNL